MPRKKRPPPSEAQEAAWASNMAKARSAQQAKRELAKLDAVNAAEGTWAYEVKRFGHGFLEWRNKTIAERGFDPAGFLETLLSGAYEVNAEQLSGEGVEGIGAYKPRPHQLDWCRKIIEHRWAATDDARWEWVRSQTPNAERPWGRFITLVVKSRRMGFSTNHANVLHAEGDVNRGCNAVISANTADGLDNMYEILSVSFGGSKTVEVEDEGGEVTKVKKAKGLARRRFKTMKDSVIRLLGPTDSMGRGWNPTHLMWTEVDYLDDIDGPLNSVLPSLKKSAFSTVTLESTMRADASTGFKDYVARALRGEVKAYVYFQGWMDDITAVNTPSPEEREAIVNRESLPGADGYEFTTLTDIHKASIEQVTWWRRRFIEEGRNNLIAMKEMYPTTRDEAMESAVGVQFFDERAMGWMRSVCEQPKERRLCRYDTLDEVLDQNIWLNHPHLEVWEPPKTGGQYVIGCDGADAAMREEWEVGSECYFVVLDKQTGEQVAQWHGHANSPDFAIAIWRAARWYNNAKVVPEKNACGAVINYLVNVLGYNIVYERESFGAVVEEHQGLWGFDTKGQTRAIMVQRIQDNVNRKTVLLKSRYLVDQLDNFGKRRGRPNKQMKRKGTQCDDGPIALGLCMFGHDNAVNGAWQPKDMIDYATAPRERIDNTERAKTARGELEDWEEDDRNSEARFYLGMT